jgi:hypothetical protein
MGTGLFAVVKRPTLSSVDVKETVEITSTPTLDIHGLLWGKLYLFNLSLLFYLSDIQNTKTMIRRLIESERNEPLV